MKIKNILNGKDLVISFEFFPPKKEEMDNVLFETILKLKKFKPDFVSITYGAGGSTHEKTVDWAKRIINIYNLEVMMHLTCISSTKDNLKSVLKELEDLSIENILALRGDVPENNDGDACAGEFLFAVDLVSFIKEYSDFSVGVAGYPEGHNECSSIEEDILHLKKKVDKGADFIITQLFFDNNAFYDYQNLLEKYKINVPVLAGIMPITKYSQIIKFSEMCGVKIPEKIINKIEGKKEEEVFKIGTEYAITQCIDLIDNNVKGLHFYTLNRSNATEKILEALIKNKYRMTNI